MNHVFIWRLEDVFGLFLFLTILLLAALVFIPIWWKQFWCKHDGTYSETMACQAICNKCGKELGFIGNWRK